MRERVRTVAGILCLFLAVSSPSFANHQSWVVYDTCSGNHPDNPYFYADGPANNWYWHITPDTDPGGDGPPDGEAGSCHLYMFNLEHSPAVSTDESSGYYINAAFWYLNGDFDPSHYCSSWPTTSSAGTIILPVDPAPADTCGMYTGRYMLRPWIGTDAHWSTTNARYFAWPVGHHHDPGSSATRYEYDLNQLASHGQLAYVTPSSGTGVYLRGDDGAFVQLADSTLEPDYFKWIGVNTMHFQATH